MKNSNKIKDVIKQIKNKQFYVEYSNDELIIKFDNVNLLTLNELISAFQFQKFAVYDYSKTIKQVMSDILTKLKKQVNKDYLFDDKVELIIYRRGVRLIDNDSLPACFKYFIDSFTLNKIIKDDNPNFISNIKIYQETCSKSKKKGSCFILKLKKDCSKKEQIWQDELEFIKNK